MLVDFTVIFSYEFDFGSEWMRAKPLDTCEFDWVSIFNLIVKWWVVYLFYPKDCINCK